MNQRVCVRIFLVVLALVVAAQSQTFNPFFSFNDSDGSNPIVGVIQDRVGNLYGTAPGGGEQNKGVVYEVDTAGIETVLYSFKGMSDGAYPFAPLARDRAGNLYGTTISGGQRQISSAFCVNGCGTVFKIGASGNETVLYRFTGRADGCYPQQGLLLDKSGNMFGTTTSCGSSGNGTIFKIDGTGSFTVLHTFAGSPSDGSSPAFGHLTMSQSGSLYGTTTIGGSDNAGVVYELSKNRTLTLLHSFTFGASDGCRPLGSVALDKERNLYGTTENCGSIGSGTIWKVNKNGKETILHNIASGEGGQPMAGVTLDSKDNLYGVTYDLGAGVLYEFSSTSQEFIMLHVFSGRDGTNPAGEVLRSAKGELYGTATNGGSYDVGTVWKYVP
jgi:uncharacterized repeat protein (TIGR03803 family)